MSGFLKGRISGISRFQVVSADTSIPLFDERVKAGLFNGVFLDNKEKITGFVSIHDCLDIDLPTEKTLLGDYRIISMRVDRRLIPASSLRIKVLEATKAKMKETGKKKLLREQREAIRAAVRAELLNTIPPVTAIFDVALDTRNGVVYLSNVATTIMQDFAELFQQSFRENLVPFMALDDDLLAKVSSVTLGRDFLTWLWFKSQQREGKVLAGTLPELDCRFVSKIVLESGEGDYTETVSCAAINTDDVKEAKEAIRQGKKVKSARIEISNGPLSWAFIFDADTLQFKGVKLPTMPDQEANDTPEGMHLERLSSVSELTEKMDVLFRAYCSLRVSPDWAAEMSAMIEWAEIG